MAKELNTAGRDGMKKVEKEEIGNISYIQVIRSYI